MTEQIESDWGRWGPLADRYRRAAPRRILALDGGGIRGLITLGALRSLERRLAADSGKGEAFRLSDYFDMIGGTSTGAIIAAGLARGMSVGQVDDFYGEFGHKAFSRRKFWQPWWQSLYGDGELAKTLRSTFGADTDLGPENLQCLLVIVMRNVSTDSAWPVSSNPFAKYNDPGRADCNLRIPLWKLVRASTAAPVYFPPEEIVLQAGNASKTFLFVDGGTTPYNNPAFLLYRMATAPAYRLQWPAGERDLLVVSVGTGSAPVAGPTAEDADVNLGSAVANTLSALMSQASVDQDVNCRTIGRCTYGGVIDREVDDLIPLRTDPPGPVPADEDLGKAFTYVRYNAELTDTGLERLGVQGLNAARMRKMAGVENIEGLRAIGEALGRCVALEHLGPHIGGPAA